jgi:hypothetical protein
MPASMWPVVVDSLIRIWGGLGLVGPDGAATGVHDGAPVGWDQMLSGVAVGVDQAYDDGNSGHFEQSWRDAGPAPFAAREETGEVVCTLWRQSGDDLMAPLRAAVFDDLESLWDAIATVSVLDPTGNRVTDVHVSRGDPVQRRTTAGCLVELPFRVRFRAIF